MTLFKPCIVRWSRAVDRMKGKPPNARPQTRRRWAGRLFALIALLALAGALAFGAARYYSHYREVVATAEQRRNFVPSLRVATVQAGDPFSSSPCLPRPWRSRRQTSMPAQAVTSRNATWTSATT